MTYTLSNSELELNGASPDIKLTGTEGSADPVTIRENAGNVEIYDQSASLARVTINVATGTITLTNAAGSVVIPTADKLTVGGVIVPQFKDFRVGPLSATDVDQVAFIVHDAMELHAVSAAYAVAGASDATVMLRNCTSGQAPASGLAMLSAAISLYGTAANTPIAGAIHATPANVQVAAGSMISLDFSGTLTGLAGLCITITLKRI